MVNPEKNPPWSVFATQWLWAWILGSQFLFFLLLKGFVGSAAYFLLGPLIVYNLGIYFFPYLYFFYRPVKTVHNRFALQWKKNLETTFGPEVTMHLQVLPEGQAPLWILTHGSTVWLTVSESFISRFSPEELTLIETQIFQLWKNGHLWRSTTWTALQSTLPLWLARNPRGTELMFALPSQAQALDVVRHSEWLQLCFKVFHWMSHQKYNSSPAISPSLLFPVLTNYSEKSYFSLYQYLQNELITSLKEGDTLYEPTKSGSFVFNSDPFHRLDGSNGPGVGPPSSDWQNRN